MLLPLRFKQQMSIESLMCSVVTARTAAQPHVPNISITTHLALEVGSGANTDHVQGTLLGTSLAAA